MFAAKHKPFERLFSCEIEKELFDALKINNDGRVEIVNSESLHVIFRVCDGVPSNQKRLSLLKVMRQLIVSLTPHY